MTVSLAARCYQDGKSRVCRSLFAQAINHFAKCLQHAMRARRRSASATCWVLFSFFSAAAGRPAVRDTESGWIKKTLTFHANCRDALRSVAIFCVHRVWWTQQIYCGATQFTWSLYCLRCTHHNIKKVGAHSINQPLTHTHIPHGFLWLVVHRAPRRVAFNEPPWVVGY